MSELANPYSPTGQVAGVDRENPWPGLASFTEDARAFFFGREKETDVLSRLVRRQTLTVLFGQSGLGKSSLLQAGLFPLLRTTDHLPLYLRLDHSASAPALAEQVKAALHAAFAEAGADAPAFRSDETLWEYFHRKDVDIWSAKNRLLTPVLAFDQFEEIFTLGRADEACRERSLVFLNELACLVENRPPPAVQARLDAGELDPARFNFEKPSCQVILSLREDFLPDLEGLKQEMPALIHNRLRLKKLSGTQALEIVSRPAPHLLAEGVAERIVEFVAGSHGGSAERLAELDVEPPLLSVICRELNDRRRALGQPQITADLVSGNRREILTDFYDRSIADLPEAMRVFVEDKLLTKSGFRDNLALETALDEPGVTRPLIDTLVGRRLLRIEDRLGVQRVELTHDVLADVIRASRDARQQREAVAAAERREAATRRSMWRARILGLGAAILCVIATGGAVFGFIKQRAARTAERHARVAELAARRTAYDSDMNVAGQALAAGNLGRVRDLLEAHRPAPGRPDLRGWEWRYLWAQSRGNPHTTLCQKPYEIYSVAVSSDGRWLAIGEAHRGGLSVWDLSAKKEVYHLEPDAIGTVAAFSPAGPVLAYSSESPSATAYKSNGVRLFNVATGKSVGEIPFPGGCRGLAFSRDGHELVAASSSVDAIFLWSIPSGKKLASYPANLRGPNVVVPFSATPDLARAAWVESTGTVHVIDLRTGAPVWSLPGTDQTFLFYSVALSPDGNTLAVNHGDQIDLWDVATHRLIGTLQGAQGYAAELVFSADGKRLVSANVDQSIRIWNVATRTCEKVLLGHRSEVWRVALLPGGHTVVSGGKDGTVCLWDLSAAAAAPAYVTLNAKVGAWRFSADSRSVVTFDEDGDVVRWSGQNLGRREVVMQTGKKNTAPFYSTVFARTRFSRDLHWLAQGTAQGEVILWDLQRRKRAHSFAVESGRPALPLHFFSGDRRVMMYGVEPGNQINRISIWDLASGREIQSWPAGVNATGALALLPDQRSCVAFVWNGSVIRNLTEQRTETGGFDLTEGNDCALSPDGRQLAVSSYLGLVRIFDANSCRTEATLTDFRNAAYAVDYSPDGQRLLVADAFNGMRLWDTNNWSETLTLPATGAQFSMAAFSPDGNCLGALDANGELRIWRAPTWAQIKAAEQSSATVP